VANHLSVTKSNAIKKSHQQGLSQRDIARALDVDRKTVRRHLTNDQADDDSKRTGAPTGTSELDSAVDLSRAANSLSACEPFREAIEEKLDRGLHAQRIFQDLQIECNFQGKYWSVRRFVSERSVKCILQGGFTLRADAATDAQHVTAWLLALSRVAAS